MASQNHPKNLINLGCGQTRPENWFNADCSLNSFFQKFFIFRFILVDILNRSAYNSTNVVYINLNKRWKLSSESTDVIYASHVFEHLSSSKAKHFLGEAYRVLKPGGVIRLVVPDLYQLARSYVQSYQDGKSEASDFFLYWLNMHQEGAYSTDRNFLEKTLNLIQNYPHQHKYMYDALSLSKLMIEYGYTNFHESSYGLSSYIDEIQEVENTKEGVPSIYIEAIKPA
jgi:predicted SAM-dependent methyltransferase